MQAHALNTIRCGSHKQRETERGALAPNEMLVQGRQQVILAFRLALYDAGRCLDTRDIDPLCKDRLEGNLKHGSQGGEVNECTAGNVVAALMQPTLVIIVTFWYLSQHTISFL